MEFLQFWARFFISCVLCVWKGYTLFYYYVFVCILPGKAIPEMTYTVSGGTLNPTHSFHVVHVYTLLFPSDWPTYL